MTKQLKPLAVLVLALMLQGIIRAQEPAAAQKPTSEKPAAAPTKYGALIPLKVLVVITKSQGEKKISSLPYTISVHANGPRVSLRMGAEVPYATSQVSEGKPVPSYSYRNVGVSIDTNAASVEGGEFRLDLTVEDTSISTNNQAQGAPTVSGVPVFRMFRTNHTILLKDGQTIQLSTATDPVSGEVTRVDVTLTVVK